MRVICAGQSGMDKKKFLMDVKGVCEQKKKKVEIFSIGELMCKKAKVNENKVLNLPFRELNLIRESSFAAVLNQVPKCDNCIIDTHITFRWNNALFHAFDFEQVKQLAPDMYITLTDDVDAIYLRLKENRPNQSYSLKDIMVWREEETIISDTLARIQNVPHYIIAVNHGPEIIYKLMFENQLKKAYLSFPISLIQDMPDLIQKVDSFRNRMTKKFIAFDPATISDHRLNLELRAALDQFESIPSITIKTLGKSLKIEVKDIIEILKDIDGQIVFRDFKMIDQSEMILAYIPVLAGKPLISTGVERELEYSFSTGKDVFVVCAGKKHLSPFVTQRTTEIFEDYAHAEHYFKIQKLIK